jgi:hypothetical protein
MVTSRARNSIASSSHPMLTEQMLGRSPALAAPKPDRGRAP